MLSTIKERISAVYGAENLKILRKSLTHFGLKGLKRIIEMKTNQIREPKHPKGLPTILHVETTSRCNLHCPSCAHSELGGKGEDMTFEQFKGFVDQFDFLAKIILYGIGETLMHRDIFKMVEYAKSRGIFCGFFSNGTLLTEANRKKILDHGQDYLNLSIDGATKESFETQRAGANFEKVMENIRALTKEVKERNHPIDIAVWNCLTSANIHELPELVRLVDSLGVKKLVVQDIMFWNSGEIEENFKEKIIDSPQARRDQYFKEAKEEATRLGIKLDLLMSAGDGKRRCQLPWFFSYVTAKGLATPCNWHGWDGAKLNFGNVTETPIKEIWDSQEYVKFRENMKNQAEDFDFCKKCPMWDREMIRLA